MSARQGKCQRSSKDNKNRRGVTMGRRESTKNTSHGQEKSSTEPYLKPYTIDRTHRYYFMVKPLEEAVLNFRCETLNVGLNRSFEADANKAFEQVKRIGRAETIDVG